MPSSKKPVRRRVLTRCAVFHAVVALTVICLVIGVGLATFGSDSTRHAELMEMCSTGWKLGFGSILGMLGGRAT